MNQWAVVVQAGEGDVPVVYGPFPTEPAARRFEDREIDAPPGARAWIVEQHGGWKHA